MKFYVVSIDHCIPHERTEHMGQIVFRYWVWMFLYSVLIRFLLNKLNCGGFYVVKTSSGQD